MNRFPRTVALQIGVVLLFPFSHPLQAASPDLSREYVILESSRPDGKGGYSGRVSIHEQGPSFSIDWTLNSGENYTGTGILNGTVLGVGFGDGFTGLAVYQIGASSLRAKWLLPTAPQQVGEYELTGPASLNGVYKFANGMSGSVTIKPHGDVFNIVWNLPTGTYTGIGIRMGDTLVAISGLAGHLYGVVAYNVGDGERLQGIWTVAGENGVGKEVLGSNAQPQTQEVAKPVQEDIAKPVPAAAGR